MSCIFSRGKFAACFGAVLSLAGGAALADWDPQDGHKMHWPQLPNPNGWDICLNHNIVADDFRCSETGPIQDIHFWVSWQHDNARWDLIESIGVTLFSDGGTHPGNVLKTYNILPTSAGYSWRPAGSGLQGWHCPATPFTQENDHQAYYQINLKPLEQPWFYQTVGTRYWLGLSVFLLPDGDTDPANDPQIGWKTARMEDHYGEFSKWRIGTAPWQMVMPNNLVGDQAFVITPEPASLSLLVLAGAMMVRRRRMD